MMKGGCEKIMTVKQMARVHKALSNENRLEIFMSILQHEKQRYKDDGCFICQLMDKLRIGAPTISHHLKELTDAGLITTEKQGKFLTAHINKDILDELNNEFNI